MKRQACKRLLTAAVLCAALTVPTRAARRSVPVQIDGNPIAVSAYVERGVTYVPLRALLNTMGAWDVWWDEATGRAAAASDDIHLWADPAAEETRSCAPDWDFLPGVPDIEGCFLLAGSATIKLQNGYKKERTE